MFVHRIILEMAEPLELLFFRDYLLQPDPEVKSEDAQTLNLSISKGGQLYPMKKEEEVSIELYPLLRSIHLRKRSTSRRVWRWKSNSVII